MPGHVCIVTGASGGMGAEVAWGLAEACGPSAASLPFGAFEPGWGEPGADGLPQPRALRAGALLPTVGCSVLKRGPTRGRRAPRCSHDASAPWMVQDALDVRCSSCFSAM